MDVSTRMIEIIKLIDPYSEDDELGIFRRSNSQYHHHIPVSCLHGIDDFTLHCIAVEAKQYDMVMLLAYDLPGQDRYFIIDREYFIKNRQSETVFIVYNDFTNETDTDSICIKKIYQ